jgi:hypothetical protein
MKYSLFSLVAAFAILVLGACEPECDVTSNELVGDEWFTVEYKTTNGQNYLDEIYNLSNVLVYLDTAGGEDPSPNYELINPGYADGKFGPFHFTERYINQARNEVNSVLLYGRKLKFDYYFRKDTYGEDKLSVVFKLGVDPCNTFWEELRYYRNDVELEAYRNQQNPQIVITE